jgi:hypothetical protein
VRTRVHQLVADSLWIVRTIFSAVERALNKPANYLLNKKKIDLIYLNLKVREAKMSAGNTDVRLRSVRKES